MLMLMMKRKSHPLLSTPTPMLPSQGRRSHHNRRIALSPHCQHKHDDLIISIIIIMMMRRNNFLIMYQEANDNDDHMYSLFTNSRLPCYVFCKCLLMWQPRIQYMASDTKVPRSAGATTANSSIRIPK